MGDIDINVGIPAHKQYELNRTFKDLFKDVEFSHSRWHINLSVEPRPIELEVQPPGDQKVE